MIAYLRRRMQQANRAPIEQVELAEWVREVRAARERNQRDRRANRSWLVRRAGEQS